MITRKSILPQIPHFRALALLGSGLSAALGAGAADNASPPGPGPTDNRNVPVIPSRSDVTGGAGADTSGVAPLIPWWQTNQPPSRLVTGPQIGTEVFGGLTATPETNYQLGNVGRLPPPAGLRWGWVNAHPFLGYGLTYGTGLLSGPDRKEATLIQTVSPGLRLELGRSWQVAYTPSLVFYESSQFRDTVNQSVQLAGAGDWVGWHWLASDDFAKTDSPLVETGRQTRQTFNSTHLGGSRGLSRDWTLDLGLSQSLRWAAGFNNTYSWSTLDSVYYNLRPNLSAGLITGFGYDLIDPGVDMWSERVSGGIRGGIGLRLSYAINGGVEFRQPVSPGTPTRISPIADVSVNYQATHTTGLGLRFTKSMSPSYGSGQFSDSATLEGSVNQRILARLNLLLTGGYRWEDLRSTIGTDQVQQTSDYRFVRISFSTQFLRRGSAAVYFMLSKNDSTQAALSYSSRQVGFNMSYGF